jgi:hypothetical protein
MSLFSLLDRLFGFKRKDKKYFQDQLKKIDEKYERLTVPKQWVPGLPYNSRTKHLWDKYKEEHPPDPILQSMVPIKTGTLKSSTCGFSEK